MPGRVAAILWWVLVSAAGCAQSRPVLPSDPHFPVVSFLKEHDATSLGDALLVSDAPAVETPTGARPSLAFNSDRLWRYVGPNVSGGDYRPGGPFQRHLPALSGPPPAPGGDIGAP